MPEGHEDPLKKGSGEPSLGDLSLVGAEADKDTGNRLDKLEEAVD